MRELKNHSTARLQEAIARALSELTGEKLSVTIGSIKFNAANSTSVELLVTDAVHPDFKDAI
jgi:hypothetical protein